jgi:predicted Holliday junction resolvase-like endonuclease
MLNRNDRKALRRNRTAVSWLTLLLLILFFFITSLYREKYNLQENILINNEQLEDYHNELIEKNKTIDSLYNQLYLIKINQDTSKKVEKKYYKPKELKKDSILIQTNSDKTNKNIKDSLK